MNASLRRGRQFAAVLGQVSLSALVMAGLASAGDGAAGKKTVQTKPNIYWACVAPKSGGGGTIHLIWPQTKCPKGWRFIFWNQTGPTGPAVLVELEYPE